MKYIKILLILFFISSQNFSQNKPTVKSATEITRQPHQDDFELKMEIDRLKNENQNQTRELQKLEDKFKTDLESQKSDLIDRMNLYLFFLGIVIALIGSAINFFGKEAIKKRVEELISNTIQKHTEEKIVETLNSKITNELIEATIKTKSQDEIHSILESIKQDGKLVIKNLEEKGAEAIKAMLAAPPSIDKIELNNNLSDIEISKQNNKIRANEFFKIAYENTEDPRIKIELYKNVLEIEPNNFNALNNMAVSHINLNEYTEAIDALNKAIKINPNYLQAIANRAKAYNSLDKFEEALSDLDSAAKIDPTFEYIYSIKGNILTKQGKFEEAEVELNNSIQLNPNSSEAYFNRAYFYEERNEFDKSEADYKMAESLGIENKALLYNNMAVLFRRKKDFDKAIEYLEKGRSFNPDLANIDGTLALIYADKNDESNFYKYLQIALEKGCPVWNYLNDSGFDNYRNTDRLNKLLEVYKKKYFA